jgi:hypothetical protein
MLRMSSAKTEQVNGYNPVGRARRGSGHISSCHCAVTTTKSQRNTCSQSQGSRKGRSHGSQAVNLHTAFVAAALDNMRTSGRIQLAQADPQLPDSNEARFQRESDDSATAVRLWSYGGLTAS